MPWMNEGEDEDGEPETEDSRGRPRAQGGMRGSPAPHGSPDDEEGDREEDTGGGVEPEDGAPRSAGLAEDAACVMVGASEQTL